jgi:serine/threonine-protein kinase
MGVVAECTHLQLNERVALKLLRPDVLQDDDAVQRFHREAQSAAKLKSEYVARVTDVGELETGQPYMVMEFLEGVDLGKLIDERGRLPVPWATELMLQTAEALAEAHSWGIVHRDIKPANLFVTWRPDGTSLIKVLDFGISKSAMGTDMQLTQTQSLLGTPAYMSPEQMRSARLVDARTDMWSLGTVMYELLEGRKPFEADSFSEMCVKVAVDAPQPMSNAPFELQQVIMRCLAKSPEQRYPSMADFARDLVPFAQDTHQASVLVERMSRMLQRASTSGGGWEGATTNGGSPRVPSHVRDSASGAVRGQWSGKSDPASPFRVNSDPAISPFRTPMPPGVPIQQMPQRQGSAPVMQPPGAFVSARESKLKAGWVIAILALFIVGGVAIGVAVTGGERETPVAEAPKTDVPTTPKEPTQKQAPPPVAKTEKAIVTSEKPVADQGTATATVDMPKQVDKGDTKTVVKNAVKDPKKHKTSTIKTKQEAKVEVRQEPKVTVPVVRKPCNVDPFATSHAKPGDTGCP